MAREIIDSCYRVAPARREMCYELEVKAVSERLKQVEMETLEMAAKVCEENFEAIGAINGVGFSRYKCNLEKAIRILKNEAK